MYIIWLKECIVHEVEVGTTLRGRNIYNTKPDIVLITDYDKGKIVDMERYKREHIEPYIATDGVIKEVKYINYGNIKWREEEILDIGEEL